MNKEKNKQAGADLYGPAPSLAYGIPGVTSERRLEGLCIHFLICCLLSVCNVFTTSILLHYNWKINGNIQDVYHRPNLERAHKGRLPACSILIQFSLWYDKNTTSIQNLFIFLWGCFVLRYEDWSKFRWTKNNLTSGEGQFQGPTLPTARL